MEINRKEICRYLGYRNIVPDENINALIESCVDEVLKFAVPASFYKRFPLKIDGNLIKIENLEFFSKSLSKNLADCTEVILFAATLGLEVDRILAKYSKINVSRAVVFQSTAAAAIEAFCNECQEKIESEVKKEGLFVRPRFSPGYGDVALSIQKDFLNMIKADRTVGIILTQGDIMIPEKSVTAFMGLSFVDSKCHREGCEICGKTDCLYRRL